MNAHQGPRAVDFRCPFCGGTVHAEAETYSVLHTLPICEEFRAMEPDVYLTSARKRIEEMQTEERN